MRYRCEKIRRGVYCGKKALPGSKYCADCAPTLPSHLKQQKLMYDINNARWQAAIDKMRGKNPLDLTEDINLVRIFINQALAVAQDDTNLNVQEKLSAENRVKEWEKVLTSLIKDQERLDRKAGNTVSKETLFESLGLLIAGFQQVLKKHVPEKITIIVDELRPVVMDIAANLRDKDVDFVPKREKNAQPRIESVAEQDSDS